MLSLFGGDRTFGLCSVLGLRVLLYGGLWHCYGEDGVGLPVLVEEGFWGGGGREGEGGNGVGVLGIWDRRIVVERSRFFSGACSGFKE